MIVEITNYASIKLFGGRDTYRILGIKQIVDERSVASNLFINLGEYYGLYMGRSIRGY